MAKLAINGLGRIGRAALKISSDNPSFELAAVNDLLSAEQLAYLLKYDTVYGRFGKPVQAEKGVLHIDGRPCPVFNEKDPAALPWAKLGIDVVLECTGVFRRTEELRKHIAAGARHVVLSAPAKDDGTPMVVYGVNSPEPAPEILSAASCTTNCITPVVEIMDRRIGIRKAVMTTIHAYTASQTLVDGPRKKWRRGRAAAANFVPTSTGAARATTRVLTGLEGRFDGIAVRGPVPAGSLADIVFVTKAPTGVDAVNAVFREEAATRRYDGILGVTEDPIVSSDVIRDPRASIVDLTMTQVVDGDLVKLLAWYDNEWGYTNQMLRLALELVQR
jgi:glyceraldehyde 3-phosphate dehydrogenase